MKNKLFLFLLIHLFCAHLWAGSISGEVSYSGIFSGTTVVVAFNSPDFSEYPANVTNLDGPGAYLLDDLEDGTYYLASLMSADLNHIKGTDPYGFYGTMSELTALVISGNNDISGIDFELIDGTAENPNPFAYDNIDPLKTLQLPELTSAGTSPSLVYDGTSIYLYKHDYHGAPSAKIYVIDPDSGKVLDTHYLVLESLPNRISWIDRMVFRNGVLWASGGYGDPWGSGYIEGVFKIDIYNSTSSAQIPFSNDTLHTNGLACDGVNFFTGIDSMGVEGIAKFNPDEVSSVPSKLFIRLNDRLQHLSYGDNFLWIGTKTVYKYDPLSGNMLETMNLPSSAAELFFDGKFWTYNEGDNTLEVYSNSVTGIRIKKENAVPGFISLYQNYPNPFNPATTIAFDIRAKAHVSLKVFDVLGKEVSVLVLGDLPSGKYSQIWDAVNLPSGIYFYRLQVNEFMETRRMLLIK